MVKSVVGEETRLQITEEKLSKSSITAQIGLLVGKINPKLDRCFILDLIPTPPNDADDPPCSLVGATKDDRKKNLSSTSCLVIDKDWVAEHARQVSRMLVGGVKVVGIYVWVSEAAFKNSTLILCQTVKGVADAVPSSMSGLDERLLLHISYSPRRWTCRNCSLASNITSSSLRPCDFKMGRILNSLQTFRCLYNFDIRVFVHRENLVDARTINDILQERISLHAKELKGAKALIDGHLVDGVGDEPCSSNDLHEIELLLPFMNDASLEASSQKEVFGVLVYSGSVCSYSYLNSREPVSQAVTDIKEDIIMSLRSRLDIVSDMADGDIASPAQDDSENNSKNLGGESVYRHILQPLREQCVIPFPRRVFVPWLAGTYVCDYLLPSETFEALKDHFVELLSMKSPEDTSTILEPEKQVPSLISHSFLDVVESSCTTSNPGSLASKKGGDCVESITKRSNTFNIGGLFAAVVLLISILLGLLLYMRTSN